MPPLVPMKVAQQNGQKVVQHAPGSKRGKQLSRRKKQKLITPSYGGHIQVVHGKPIVHPTDIRELVPKLPPLNQSQASALALHVPQTYRELWQYCAVVFGVKIPYTRVCDCHVSPFEAFADAYFAEHSISIWWGARGLSGKTFLLGLLALVEQVTLGAHINVLGGSGEQSERILQYLKGEDATSKGKFWDSPNAPHWLFPSGNLHQDFSKEKVQLINGGKLIALKASQRSVRGPHPQRLRVDEIDEMDDKILESAIGQTMEVFVEDDNINIIEPQIVLSSTWQYPDKTFYNRINTARERGWGIFPWCYRESMQPWGWLSKKQVNKKRHEVSTQRWENEYELGEPSIDGRVFDQAAVDRAFDRRLGDVPGKPNESYIFEHPTEELVNGEMYHTGTDWAKKVDWTVMATFKRGVQCPMTDKFLTPDICVCWGKYGRRNWPSQVQILNNRYARYPGASAHDGTGIGDVLNDYLDHTSVSFIMGGGRARSEFFSAYITAIEHGKIRYPMIRSAYEDHKRCTWEDLFGKGHPPDSVVAGAMAWHARQFGGAACGASSDEGGHSQGGQQEERTLGEIRRFWQR